MTWDRMIARGALVQQLGGCPTMNDGADRRPLLRHLVAAIAVMGFLEYDSLTETAVMADQESDLQLIAVLMAANTATAREKFRPRLGWDWAEESSLPRGVVTAEATAHSRIEPLNAEWMARSDSFSADSNAMPQSLEAHIWPKVSSSPCGCVPPRCRTTAQTIAC